MVSVLPSSQTCASHSPFEGVSGSSCASPRTLPSLSRLERWRCSEVVRTPMLESCWCSLEVRGKNESSVFVRGSMRLDVLYSIRNVRCAKRCMGCLRTAGGLVPAQMSIAFQKLTQSISAIDIGPSPPREEYWLTRKGKVSESAHQSSVIALSVVRVSGEAVRSPRSPRASQSRATVGMAPRPAPAPRKTPCSRSW